MKVLMEEMKSLKKGAVSNSRSIFSSYMYTRTSKPTGIMELVSTAAENDYFTNSLQYTVD